MVLLTLRYIAYLQSDAWREKRARCLNLAGRRCSVCRDQRRLQAHHLTYARIYRETDADLLCLCRRHHKRAERLIAEGKLSRFGDVLELRAITIRLLVPRKARAPRKRQKARTKSAQGGFKQPKFRWEDISEAERHTRSIERLEKLYA